MSRLRRLSWLVIALGLLVGGRLTADHSRSLRSEIEMNDVAYLPTTDALRLISFGYDDVTADLLWLRTVTYYGAWRHGEHGIDYFRELTHRVVELDPQFVDAYRFGSMVLADDLNDFDAGVALLQLGMQNIPGEWQLPFDIGFLEYTLKMDDAAAAEWFLRAAEMPGAPEMTRRFAAFVTSRAGDLEKSYVLWKYVAETSENPDMRKKAEQYMKDLEPALTGTGPPPEWAERRRVINGRSSDGDV